MEDKDMKQINCQVRKIIVKHYGNGKNPKEIAEMVFCSIATVYRIIRIYRENGSTKTKKREGHNQKITLTQDQQIRLKYAEKPDITLLDLIAELELNITESGLSRHVAKMGFSHKKRHSIPMGKNAKTSLKSVKNGEKISPN
jgi:transposase